MRHGSSVKMSLLLIIILSNQNISSNCFNKFKKVKMFSKALSEIITKFYIKNSIEYEIIAPDIESWKFASNIIPNLAKDLCLRPTRIRFIDESNFNEINLTRSSIFLFESGSSYARILNMLKMHNIEYMKIRHFAVINVIGNMRLGHAGIASSIYVTNLLIHQNDLHLNLGQFTTKCGTNSEIMIKFQLINAFRSDSLSWTTDVFELTYPMINLNGCNYNVMCKSCFHDQKQKKLKLIDSDYLKLLGVMEERLNFNATLVDATSSYHFVFDLILFKGESLFHTFVIATAEFTLIFSTGEPYSQIEKLTIPYDTESWIAISITFSIGFLIILLLKNCKIELQNFVFGLSVKTPTFNMIKTFFGQSQNIEPRGTFARYLLMMFILFCLIIRTGYQGVQFELIYQVRLWVTWNEIFKL